MENWGIDDQGRTAAMVRFTSAMKKLREHVGSDFTTQQTMILVALWLDPGQSQTELAKVLDLKIAAASRHCRSLSEFTRPKGDSDFITKGQHLIIGARDPRRANTMRYRLTEESIELMNQFASDLAGVEL
jgi:DNA-binding MarR family transcriptional regulator